MVLSMLSGCASDPIATYRIGERLDVAALRQEFGEENVGLVRLEQEHYAYHRCTLDRRDAKYEIEVSMAGRIVGLTVKVPCKGPNVILSRRASLEKRLNALYADGGERPAGNKVEIAIRYEPGSGRLVATCREPDHAAVVRAWRKRVRQPER